MRVVGKFAFHRTFEYDGLADGAKFEDSWVADKDYVIVRVHIRRKDGYALHKSTFYWKIGDRVFTRPVVPAGILAEDALISPVLNVPFTKGEKLDFTFLNLEGATIDVFITFDTELK